jgi:hypothetical protein
MNENTSAGRGWSRPRLRAVLPAVAGPGHSAWPRCAARFWRVAGAAVLAGIGPLAAACGGGSHPAGSGASSPPGLAQALDAYAHCMRGHGLPGVYVTRAPSSPNPGTALMIFHGFAIEGADSSSPGFGSAQSTCQHLLPQGTPPTAAELHQQFLSAVKSARCMRSHGYPDWPDPQVVDGRVGIGFPSSGIDVNSPQFQSAAKACGQPVPPGG